MPLINIQALTTPLLCEELETNLKMFLNDGLLRNAAAWQDVNRPTSGVYGGDFAKLRPYLDNDAHTTGRIWQGIRKDWVYETGINYDADITGSVIIDYLDIETEYYFDGWGTDELGDLASDELGQAGISSGDIHVLTITENDYYFHPNDVLRVTNATPSSLNKDYTILKTLSAHQYLTDSQLPAESGSGTWELFKNPNEVSVYVNSGFMDPTGYYINYPMGWVVMNEPVGTGNVVEANYSYRNVQVYRADEAPWWNAIQTDTLDPTDVHFTQANLTLGEWSIGAHHRVQLPCVVIEAIPRGTAQPYELGAYSLVREQDVLFNIITETRFERNQLIDILLNQQGNIFWLYNTQSAARNSSLPLDYRGMLVGSQYSDLVSLYPRQTVRWTRCAMSEVESIHPKLYEAVIRVTFEIVWANLV